MEFMYLLLKDSHEYIQARNICCSTHHSNCEECKAMLTIAHAVLKNEYVNLRSVFISNFSVQNYNPHHARHRLLQMPLACIRVDYKPGVSECVLVEHHSSVDYKAYANLLCTLIKNSKSWLHRPKPWIKDF